MDRAASSQPSAESFARSHSARRPQRTHTNAVAMPAPPTVEAVRAPVPRPVRLPEFDIKTLEPRVSQSGTIAPPTPSTDTWHSCGWHATPSHLPREAMWQQVRAEAQADAEAEPALGSFFHSSVLMHSGFPKSLAFVLANRLHDATLSATSLMRLFIEAFEDDPDIIEACSADLQAVKQRDPACEKLTQPLLFFKGFQALQTHRIAHWLWKKNRRALAMALHSRAALSFQVDIHPAAVIGRGVFIDHATGVCIGETAVVGDNVSMLHHTCLGGSGSSLGTRHPTVGHGVLLGAGACVVGPVAVGAGSKVGARSVVVQSIPSHSVAVGVPAKVIKRDKTFEPSFDMNQVDGYILDFQI